MKHQSDPSARNPAAPDTSDTPDRSPADMTPDPKHAAPPSSTSTEPAEAETHSFTVDATKTEALAEAENPKEPLPREKRYLLPRLFLTMLKIGLFAFGGGYAMTALLETELVAKRGWLRQDEFLDMTAIAESTPGPLAVNSATYVGYRLAGVGGAALATLAVCLPAFVIIYLISLIFDRFLSLTYITYAFRGVQVAVVYLIATAGVRLFRGLGRDPLGRTLAVVSALALIALSLFSVNFSSVFFILIGGVLGLAVYLIRKARRGGDAK